MFLVVPFVMVIVGYFIMKKSVWGLIDEVCDDGTGLFPEMGNKKSVCI